MRDKIDIYFSIFSIVFYVLGVILSLHGTDKKYYILGGVIYYGKQIRT